MVGIISIFKPVIRQVIEPNKDINNLLPPMANFGDKALATVKDSNATVVIMDRDDIS